MQAKNNSANWSDFKQTLDLSKEELAQIDKYIMGLYLEKIKKLEGEENE